MSDHEDLTRRLERLETSLDKIPEQFEKLTNALTGKLDGFHAEITVMSRKIDRQDNRLTELEKSAQEIAKRKALIRKIILGLLTAIGGAVGSKIIDILSAKGHF